VKGGDPEFMKIGRYSVKISRRGKVLFPEDGFTKEDLIAYYREIASWLLPYTKDRPISMERYPDGLRGDGFYQKEIPDYFPDWIDRVRVRTEDDSQQQVMVNKAATIVYLAEQACITPHTWLSRKGALDKPDKMIFDLDPPGGGFGKVRHAARLVKGALEKVGLVPFVMTTGSRGLHVVVPLDGGKDFDYVRDFAHRFCTILAEREKTLTVEQRKNKRKGRIFLDYLRNAYGQTAVAPYSVRARNGAPVAAPLDWGELESKNLGSQTYNIRNIFKRLSQKGDPWKGMRRHARSLTKPVEALARDSR
jgi:bifunctional non-homologous end joining protein LigD